MSTARTKAKDSTSEMLTVVEAADILGVGRTLADQKDRSPFEQAESNRHKITTLLKEAGVRYVPIGHCVMFKAGRPSGNLGPDAPPAITLTGTVALAVRGRLGW